MKKGIDVIEFAKTLNGRGYDFGAIAPKNDPNYKGKFDCAELIAYCNFQVFGILYGTNTHDLKKAAIADAFTGYFKNDANILGIKIPVDTAIKIPGAMLLRYAAPGTIGHIVFTQGNAGKTMSVEAHSTKMGCGEFPLAGRHFDTGILLPGVQYDQANFDVKYVAPKVYKLTVPMIHDDFVKQIQKALGFKGKMLDGVFGLQTNAAVVAFQKEQGLVVDGQLTADGETAKALGIAS